MIDPKSALTSGYHVFLEPEGETYTQLVSVIRKLSVEYGAPLFEPHVTLLAAIPEEDEAVLSAKASALAASLTPFDIVLDTLEAKDRYFQCLYAKAHVHEALRQGRAHALEIFDMQEVGEYMPHLSLLYGNFDSDQKDRTIESLSMLLPISFRVCTMSLWKTPGDATTWTKVREFPFGA